MKRLAILLVALMIFGITNTASNAQSKPKNLNASKELSTPQTKTPRQATPDKPSEPEKAQVAPIPVQPVQTAEIAPNPAEMSHEQLMSAAGISPADFSAVEFIVMHESTWRSWAQEPTTKAHGLCQSLPASKMASAGADYLTNPVTQLKWCNQYAQKYGGWQGAYAFWLNNRWW